MAEQGKTECHGAGGLGSRRPGPKPIKQPDRGVAYTNPELLITSSAVFHMLTSLVIIYGSKTGTEARCTQGNGRAQSGTD